MNDPNGLVFYKGYYHVFYQMCPNEDKPWIEPMHWGHARTRDFLTWEDLPVALTPDTSYDKDGCWSGTAIVKDDTLFLFYSSVLYDEKTKLYTSQTVSIATSTDGINFKKYEGNPVINSYPEEGSFNFRDPAIIKQGDSYKLIMATGHDYSREARLLMYTSYDLLNWELETILMCWPEAMFAECPSMLNTDNDTILGVSIVKLDDTRTFSLMAGTFNNSFFLAKGIGFPLKGPDQYAGQLFKAEDGRPLLLTWIPGWHFADSDTRLGCLSVPMEVIPVDKRIHVYPIREFHHLLKSCDDAVELTDTGLVIHRPTLEDVVYEGEIRTIAILHDEYVLEVFINDGEAVITAVII